jgi:hypothetical protein
LKKRKILIPEPKSSEDSEGDQHLLP